MGRAMASTAMRCGLLLMLAALASGAEVAQGDGLDAATTTIAAGWESSPRAPTKDDPVPESPEDIPAAAVVVQDETTPSMDEPGPTGTSRRSAGDATAADVLKRILAECVQLGSFSCIKPKVLSFLSAAAKKDKILLTEDMSLEKTAKYLPDLAGHHKWDGDDLPAEEMLRRVDDFLGAHQLKVRLPKDIVTGSLVPYVPKFLLRDLPSEIAVPLAENSGAVQERGFIRKIVMPFLLGLKFKATALVPLALGLIAVKTWKALTLGLLSLVLSGAMLVFKLTKPKVVNYEVYHYPQHTAPAVIEHAAPAAAYEPHHGWGRSLDVAYRGHARP